MARVVVIGAGVGGLAAAARLGAAGHAVTVLEQAPAIGGKLGRYDRDGYTFDLGPSLLTLPQVFADLFDATGGPLPAVLDLEPVEPIARTRFADGTWLDSSADPAVMAANLEQALSPGSASEWRRLMTRAAGMWETVREPVLSSALAGPAALARLTQPRALATIAPHRTLRGLGRRYLHEPRLRTFLDRYATYSGSDPRRAPAVLAVVPYVEQTFGGWYVRGGLYRLGEAIAERARERGAQIRTGTDVIRIETAGGRASGVRLRGGERLPADVVVANADAAHLYGDLVAAPGARRALRRVQPSLSGFVLLLGIRGRTPGLAHHTVLFPADYDAEFDALFGAQPRPLADPTLYISAPRDPSVAPPGCEAWFVLVNAPRQGQGGVDWDTPGLAQRYAGRLLDLLAQRGLDVRERLAFCEFRTPAELARRTRAFGGAIYGTSSNGVRAAFLRPANRSPVPGLFLVGGSSHPGGGLPLVTLSAKIVADLVGPA